MLDLFERDWIIHTRSEERLPASIRRGASLEQCLISDGCLVEGHVAHSVLSPGVIVREGARVSNSVVMTDAVVEPGAVLDHAILDKRTHVGRGAQIGRDIELTSDPAVQAGPALTVIGKNTRIPPEVRVGRNCTIAADLPEDVLKADLIPDETTIGFVIG